MTTTEVGSHFNDASQLRMRGRDTLSEIIGKMTFTEGFYLITTGRQPTAQQTRLLDAALLILMDHGLTPSALVARMVADSNRDDIQVPLAAGILMVGNRFAGTMVGAGRLLGEGIKESDKEAWAKRAVEKHRDAKQRIPGFGHNAYTTLDPRADRLFEVAREVGVKGDYIDLLHVLSRAVDAGAKKHIVLNATGALGAILHEIQFPVEVMRSVAVVGRCAGLVGHINEEYQAPIVPALFEFSESISYKDSPAT